MTIQKARFAAATVMALRCATATKEHLQESPPSLRELNIDLTECTEREIAELESFVAAAWNQRQVQLFSSPSPEFVSLLFLDAPPAGQHEQGNGIRRYTA
jgi:hypothetical protein